MYDLRYVRDIHEIYDNIHEIFPRYTLDIQMIRCEKNNIFKIGDFVSASFTLPDT